MTGLRTLLRKRESDALLEAATLAQRSRPGDIGGLAKMEQALDEADRAGRLAARVTSEPLTYSEHSEFSFFRDILAADRRTQNRAAADRLRRHAVEVAVERRDLTRTDGAAGEFTPPLWLIDRLARPARSNRPFADAIGSLPLPASTDTIPIPIVTASGATAPQIADNATINQLNPSTSSTSMPVRTVTGQIGASIQLLDQTPAAAFDLVYAGELLDDYDATLETQLWNGTGVNGQLLGILNTVGITSVAYTDATPTVPELTPLVAKVFGQTTAARKRADIVGYMTPTRWAWIAGSMDTQNRTIGEANVGTGEMLSWAGQRWQLSPGIPVNLGAGTNQDVVVATRPADHLLLEGTPQVQIFPGLTSGTLSVRVRLYRYVAFTAARYPSASGVVSGTGLTAPW